jgi:hypothetical protein
MHLSPLPGSTPRSPEPHQFRIFHKACQLLENAQIPYALGGGVAVRAYGRRRELKDADIFLAPKHVMRAMNVLTARGGFHTRDTDANWLYKALQEDVLIDLIVQTTGHVPFNEQTFARSRIISVAGHPLRLMGPEDLLLRKILSHQQGRPDEEDALSMLQTQTSPFDWPYFKHLAKQYHPARIAKFFEKAKQAIAAPIDWAA